MAFMMTVGCDALLLRTLCVGGALLTLAACAGSLSAPAATPRMLSGVTKMAAGWTHACAVTADGHVVCWGNNQDGQLGDGTRTPKRTPEPVVGLLSTVKEVAAGERHSCALTSAGTAKCWGSNHDGQLGDGTQADHVSPVDVVGLQDSLRAITVGERHTCVVTAVGGVKCWGSNREGQLGDGTTELRRVPVAVLGLERGVVAVAAGWRHTCAITTSGGVKCWGSNTAGQVGDGTTVSRVLPVDVSGLTAGATLVAGGGQHTCAVVGVGLRCWGRNERGQLGDGSMKDTATSVAVNGISGVGALAAGWQHTCAVTTMGAASCWGNNEKGQVAVGDALVRPVPGAIAEVPMAGEKPLPVLGIATGGQFTCLLTADTVATCWGDKEYVQLDGARKKSSSR